MANAARHTPSELSQRVVYTGYLAACC